MKKGWIVALLLLLLGGGGAFVWYSTLKKETRAEGGAYDGTLKPRIEMAHFSVNDIGDESLSLTIHLLVDNPLPIAFKAHNLDFSYYINGQEMARDAYREDINVASKDSTVLKIPVELMRKKLVGVLKELEAKGVDSSDYRIRTKFDLDIPILGKRTFTIDKTKRMPTVHIPKFDLLELDYGKFGLKEMDMAARVAITNKNVYPYNITDTHYSVTVDGKELASGHQPEPILVKKESVTPVVFPFTVNTGTALGLMPKALFDKDDTPVVIQFRCKVLDKKDNPTFQKSQFKTTIRGTLAEFRKKQKK